MYLGKKRSSRFDELFKEWNAKHGAPKGVLMQWNQDFHTMGRIGMLESKFLK